MVNSISVHSDSVGTGTVGVGGATTASSQSTATSVTSAVEIVPLPLLTTQVWPVGCVDTVTT
jgi:hypothetical protein